MTCELLKQNYEFSLTISFRSVLISKLYIKRENDPTFYFWFYSEHLFANNKQNNGINIKKKLQYLGGPTL